MQNAWIDLTAVVTVPVAVAAISDSNMAGLIVFSRPAVRCSTSVCASCWADPDTNTHGAIEGAVAVEFAPFRSDADKSGVGLVGGSLGAGRVLQAGAVVMVDEDNNATPVMSSGGPKRRVAAANAPTTVFSIGGFYFSGVFSRDSRRIWQLGKVGEQAMISVNDTGSDREVGVPYQLPVRWRTPVTVTAVMPGRSAVGWAATIRPNAVGM